MSKRAKRKREREEWREAFAVVFERMGLGKPRKWGGKVDRGSKGKGKPE